MLSDIQLGPFILGPLLGQGGMGQVFHGRHVEQKTNVAVKILTSEHAHNEEYRASFKAEVQSVAGLNHPGVVMVFDMGTIDAAVARRSAGMLVSGAPYLVMEYIGGGSLFQFARQGLPWARLRAHVFSLLDSLSHAHGRGVIHRDIKPANILLTAKRQSEQTKLGDFGIAHAMRFLPRPGDVEDAFGTAQYMSPEQFMGRFREYGPWTDLYSLGCVTHHLLTGRLPFEVPQGKDPHEALSHAHIYDQPPPLRPLHPAPAGIGAWVLKMMAKSPWDRFHCAADAARALIEVERAWVPPLSVGPVPAITRRDCPTLSFAVSTRPSHTGPAQAKKLERAAPEMPESHETSVEAPALKLQGVGLGLYGLRRLPLVGRRVYRDALWETLAQVRDKSAARLVIIRGPAGVGKSGLMRWFVERVGELGAATTLEAQHSPIAGYGDGVPRMLTSAFRCGGLDPEKTRRRIRRYLKMHKALRDETTATVLTKIVLPEPSPRQGATASISLNSAAERHAAIYETLATMSQHRPVVLCLEDVQWGSDALCLAAHILKAQRRKPSRVMVVLTAREESLAQRPVEWHMLTELAGLDNVQRLDLSPLDDGEHEELVERLLNLCGDLAREVIERTAGNPLFAIQLVGDWVLRGVLEVGEHGFVLAAGEEAVFPDTLHELWSTQLTKILDGQEKSDWIGLELAAALGSQFDRREWVEACKILSIKPPLEAVQNLIDERLLLKKPGGWAFVHNMMRECLERHAREAGRFTALQRACATMLERDINHHEGKPERLARHLLEAGDALGAVEPLLQAARQAHQQCFYEQAIALLELGDEASAELEAGDTLIGSRWALRAEVELERGRLDSARNWIIKLSAAASSQLERGDDWEELSGAAELLEARLCIQDERLAEAEEFASRSLRRRERLRDTEGQAAAMVALADVSYWRGELPRSAQRCQAALKLCGDLAAVEDNLRAANLSIIATHRLGNVYTKQGRYVLARQAFEEGLIAATEIGHRLLRAILLDGIAECERASGDLSAAEAHNRQAHGLLLDIGSAREVNARLQTSLTLLARGESRQVQGLLEEAEPLLREAGDKRQWAKCLAQWMVCDADNGRRDQFDARLAELTQITQSVRTFDPDVAWCAERAGQIWIETSIDHARRSLLFSRHQWATMSREEDVRRVEEALGAV